MEQLEAKNRVIKLNPLLYFAFEKGEGTRRWMFAEIGKMHTVTEKDEKIEIISECL